MRFERLTPGEIISAIAALTLLGLMQAVWFEHPTAAEIAPEALGFETAPDAWHAFGRIDVVLAVTIVCALSAAVVAAAGRRPPLPLNASAAVTTLGLISAGLLLFRIVASIEIDDVEYRRNLALFLGFGMTLLIAGGGALTMLAEGTTLRAEISRAASGRRQRRDRARRAGGRIKLGSSD